MKLSKALPAIIFFMILSCARKKVETSTPIKETKMIMNESFDKFYNKFHTDSVFQISRLYTPISGKSTDHDTTFNWTKQNWELIKFKIRDLDTSKFKINIIQNESYVKEKVEYKNESGFHFESVYKLIEGKWYLVECNDYNL